MKTVLDLQLFWRANLCCAPAGTECPDLNSYKTATEVWWQSKEKEEKIEEKFDFRPAMADLNNFRHTFDRIKLPGGSVLEDVHTYESNFRQHKMVWPAAVKQSLSTYQHIFLL